MLGYRDSGMAGSEANANPASFAQAPQDEAVERLVAVVRRTRPQVMVVYGDDQSGYPHPDHLRVHEIGAGRLPAAGDPDRYPGGRARPGSRASCTTPMFSVARFREIHEKFEELGLESPFDDAVAEALGGGPAADPITTSVDISEFADVRRRGPAGPRHPGRPQVPVLVRAAARGDAHHPSLRRLPAGPRGRTGRGHRRPGGAGATKDLTDRSRPTCSPACDRRSPAAERPGELKWLSAEWFDQTRAMAADLPDRPGLSARSRSRSPGVPTATSPATGCSRTAARRRRRPGTVEDADVT